MRIIEDKVDRDRLFHLLTEQRFIVRAKQYEPLHRAGWPRKHELAICVRLGAGARWLREHRNWTPPTRKGAALNFLRGHSHEALATEGQSIVFVYEGVANEIDEWTGEPDAPFTEIKSTAVSSARMWPIVQRGEVDLLHPFEDSYFDSYFQQCCQNCVATSVDRCRLRVFFMNGDYAHRRKVCPECKATLGNMRDIYKECPACHYKSYSIDLRSYILTFSYNELRHYRRTIFRVRRDQYNLAIQSDSVDQLLMRAEPTQCFLCSECDVGKAIGCERAPLKEEASAHTRP